MNDPELLVKVVDIIFGIVLTYLGVVITIDVIHVIRYGEGNPCKKKNCEFHRR
jgi:hypothetical protein